MNIPQSRDNLAVVSSQRSLTPTRMAPFFMNYNAQKSIGPYLNWLLVTPAAAARRRPPSRRAP